MARRVITSLRFGLRQLGSGFTLVELMVALTGGLFISMTVFMMAKESSRFYQRQTRVGQATSSAITAFERLRADLARAAFMSSPNIQRDPRLSEQPTSDWPLLMNKLQGITIDKGVSGDAGNGLPQVLADNGIAPDRILIAGAFTASEQFDVSTADSGPGGTVVVPLQVGSGALLRLGNPTAAQLQAWFPAGSGVRIVDYAGQKGHHYGVVQATTPGAQPSITLAQFPSMTLAGSSGLQGLGSRGYSALNVVNWVRYSLHPKDGGAGYAPIYADNAPGDGDRTDLFREVLDAAGSVLNDSNGNPMRELVAEFAVDLRFGLVVGVRDGAGNTAGQSVNVIAPPIPPDQTAVTTEYASDNPNDWQADKGPEWIRAVWARLSVRSREGDREGDFSGISVSSGLYRFKVGDNVGRTPYARVRTLQARVALQNQTSCFGGVCP